MKSRHKAIIRWPLILLVFLLLGALFAATPAQAAVTRGGDTVVIGAGEVIDDDLYVAANQLTIDGVVKGDVVAVANQITINGTVEGDLLAGAQSIVLNGTVGDDMRAGGQAIVLGPRASVKGDLAAGGMSLENQSGSVVGGDLLVGAYQALLSGAIGRNIRGGLSRLELRGVVGRDVDVAVNGSDQGTSAVQFATAGQTQLPSVAPNLTLADTARIGGKLIYQSSAAATISPAAQVASGVSFDQLSTTASASPTSRIPGLAYLQRLAALLLVGLLLIWLAPAWVGRLAGTVEARPLPSIGWGLVAFGAFLAAFVVILALTIGLALLFGALTLGGLVGMIVSLGVLLNGALVVGWIGIVAYVAQIVVGYMAGRWLLSKLRPAWLEWPVAPLATGLILYVALRAIPWLGGLLALLVVLLGLGALWDWGRATFGRARPAPLGGLQPA